MHSATGHRAQRQPDQQGAIAPGPGFRGLGQVEHADRVEREQLGDATHLHAPPRAEELVEVVDLEGHLAPENLPGSIGAGTGAEQ